MRKRMTAALLSLALALSPLLSGCGGPPRLQARDLMAEVPAPKVPVDTQMTEDSAAAVMDFCVRLFPGGRHGGENVLISPVSVLYAPGYGGQRRPGRHPGADGGGPGPSAAGAQ